MFNLQHLNSPGLGAESPQSSKAWFAVQTWPRYEKKVATEFQRKGIESFLPLLCSKHQWSDRRRLVESPLFPSYVFINMEHDSNTRIPVLRTNGVAGFVGPRGIGTTIPEAEIESVRLLLANGVTLEHHPFLRVGERVRIRGGSLDGVEGILLSKHEDPSLLVSIQIIQKSLVIRVAGNRLEQI